jgi:xylan 1,4-beta-xylosidase
MKIQHDAIGFRSVRFHGLFDDDMQVVTLGGGWNWTTIDNTYDFLYSLQIKPYVELDFMPTALASSNASFLHYHANVSPPRNYTEWGEFIEAFATHLVERYGIEEVATWKFECWNEPNLKYPVINGFWAGTQAEYFKLYQTTALALKRVSALLQVGGPTTSAGGWLVGSGDFIRFCLSTGNMPSLFGSIFAPPSPYSPASLLHLHTLILHLPTQRLPSTSFPPTATPTLMCMIHWRHKSQQYAWLWPARRWMVWGGG